MPLVGMPAIPASLATTLELLAITATLQATSKTFGVTVRMNVGCTDS